MKEIKVVDDIYEKAENAVLSARNDVKYWQRKLDYSVSRLSDLHGENGEKIADRRRLEMRDNGACDYYDEFGRMSYLTADDLRREVDSEIYRLKKKLESAKEVLAEKQAELERVRLILSEDEARIFEPIVEWKLEDDEDDLVF